MTCISDLKQALQDAESAYKQKRSARTSEAVSRAKRKLEEKRQEGEQ